MDRHAADNEGATEAEPAGTVTAGEYRYACLAGLAVLAVTCLPYLLCWYATPDGTVFPGVLFNADDHGVYFAWMRQARDGNFFLRNLFTNEPQHGKYVHLYFWALGLFSRFSRLPIPLVYHLARVVTGVVVLVLVYRLGAFFTDSRFTRRTILWTTALSGGFGWIRWHERITLQDPVDAWQPEALTFQSLYTNGLFTVSLALMLGIVVGLLLAETRRDLRYAAVAGLCGLLLANIHTYDLLTLTCVWAAYLAAACIARPSSAPIRIKAALVAALIALPGMLHQYHTYRLETVFQTRVAVPTRSPDLHLYLAGYGLLLPLALWGAYLLLRRVPVRQDPRPLLLVLWATLGFAIPYIPVAFQRKLVMGLHFPLALLAGLAVAGIAQELVPRAQGRGWAIAAAAVICATAITPARFMLRDVQVALDRNLTSTGMHPVWWPGDDFAVLNWMSGHLPRDAVVLCNPLRGVMVPAVAARTVYAGHWGETPMFARKVSRVAAYYGGSHSDPGLFLKDLRVSHVFYGVTEKAISEEAKSRGAAGFNLDPSLREVFRSGDSVLYARSDP